MFKHHYLITLYSKKYYMSLINDLNWRYATKTMNGETVSAEKLNAILDAINLSSSSFGLQPYTVLVVGNTDTKNTLQAAAFGQPQVGSSSHVLVFCVPTKLSAEDAKTFITNVSNTRGIPQEALAGYEGMIAGTINGMNEAQQQIWAAKQAYIALGIALAAAAEQKVDACPMEGFDTAKFDDILGLEAKGLKSVVIMPIGYRSVEDATANYKKVRKAKTDMFVFVD
jgi:nitroreductase / dihydropteridine reductase